MPTAPCSRACDVHATSARPSYLGPTASRTLNLSPIWTRAGFIGFNSIQCVWQSTIGRVLLQEMILCDQSSHNMPEAMPAPPSVWKTLPPITLGALSTATVMCVKVHATHAMWCWGGRFSPCARVCNASCATPPKPRDGWWAKLSERSPGQASQGCRPNTPWGQPAALGAAASLRQSPEPCLLRLKALDL